MTLTDIRFAWRMLAKSPGFTAIAVLTLALGIGATTAVFSIVDAVLLRPLPYKDPQRLVAIWDRLVRDGEHAKIFNSYRDFEEWKARARSFDDLAAATWATGGRIMTGRGPARDVLTIPVSQTFFSMLGAGASLGRTFTPEDLTRGCSVVLSDRFGRGTLQADRTIVGQSITLNQQSCTVLGVMPATFAFYPPPTGAWILVTPDFKLSPQQMNVGVFGRLKPGVTLEQAQTEVAAIHAALHESDGRERGVVPAVYNLQEEFTWLTSRTLRATVWVLFAAVGFVLLIACLNVANLLLGRSLTRERELAVRAALGSGQVRLLRQMLTEGLLLSLLGGVGGALAAFGSVRYFRAEAPVELPVGADVAISLPVLAFSLALSIATAVLCAIAPAWKAARVDPGDVLKSGGRGSGVSGSRQRLAKVLIAGQVAMSVILLTGAGLLIESVLNFGSEPLGFEPRRVMTSGVTLFGDRYARDETRLRFYDDLSRRLAKLPDVEGAALATRLGGTSRVLQVEGRVVPRGSEVHDTGQQFITPDYFQVLGIALRRGRALDARDRRGSEPVAVVSEALVSRYFAAVDPLGRHIRVGGDATGPWITIVGVVANQKRQKLYPEMSFDEPPLVFRPLAQEPPRSVEIAIRSAGSATAIPPLIQREVDAIDRDVPLGGLESMSQQLDRSLAYPRFRATLLAAFAAVSLLLAVVGLQGVLAQFVARRTHEIGVRIAVGAQAAHVVRLVAAQGGVAVVAGLVVGVVAALALGRFLTNLLFGVRPTDPLTFIAVSATLLATAAIAIAIPARRATRVDPMAALRCE